PADFNEDPVGNQFLVAMIAKAGNVVLPLRFTLAETGRAGQPAPDFVEKSSLMVLDEAVALMDRPYPQSLGVSYPFPAACNTAWGMGHVNTWQDVDGKVRRDPLTVDYAGNYYPSMSLQLVRAALDLHRAQVKIDPGKAVTLASKSVPTDESGMLRIDYRGPEGTIHSVSAARVLEGQVDSNAIKGKIVVVGVTASGYGTALHTSGYTSMPRAEKIATVAANMLDNRYIRTLNLSGFLDLAILAMIAMFCAVVLPRVTLANRIVILVVMAFLFLNANFALFHSFKVITKTLYPTLEILVFLLFAPFVKSAPSAAPVAAPVIARKARPESPMIEAAGANATAASPLPSADVASDGVRVRNLDQSHAMGPITGLSKTVAVEEEHVMRATPEPARPTVAPKVAPINDDLPAVDLTAAAPEPESMVEDIRRQKAMEDSDGSGTPSRRTSGPIPADLTQLGRYEILGVLGQGAMGTVYKGKDPAIGRLVALKTIRAGVGADADQAEELRERLVREAKAAGTLSHPNIVTIYDVAIEGDLNYIAMEYLEGCTLEEFVRKKVALNFRIVAKMLTQVCSALDYAHKAGIVHRDIKPANIMVLNDYLVKVTDFGIARFEQSGMSMTQTGIALGTPYYISPEQLRGGAVDRRCDLFSLGVVAHELLTHKRPFNGESISALIYAITQTNPDPPSRIDPTIPGLFDLVIGRALAKDPRQRYQTAAEMAHDLGAFVEDMAPARSFRI
ncbi:MAG: protein kinase, partial [candidate division Zixibacteria bacterium]|nr:protein kinase [candidate division Zixibacteria bacterium]